MKTNRYDPLDKFFRDRLNSDHLNRDTDWNNPPDGIFEQAMDTIGKKPKKSNRRILFFIVLSGIVALLAGYSAYITYFKIDKLEHSLAELQLENFELKKNNTELQISSIDQLRSESRTDQSPNYNPAQRQQSNLLATGGSTILKHSGNHQKNTDSYHSKTISRNTSIVENKGNEYFKESEPSFMKDPGINFPFFSTNSIIQNQGLNNGEDKRHANANENRLIPEFFELPRMLNRLDNTKTLFPEMVRTPEVQPLKFKSARGWNNKRSLSVIASFHPSKFMMSNTGTNNFSLTEYDHYYAAWGLGLKLEQAIHPLFDLYFGLGYKTYTNKSKYTSTLRYDLNKEYINHDLQREYSTAVQIESPVGAITDTARFLLRSVQISGSDSLKLKSSIQQKIQLVGLRTGLNYRLFKSNRFSINVSAGLMLQHIIKLENILDNQIYFYANQMMNKTSALNQRLNLNSWLLSIEGAVEFNYLISPNLLAGLGTGLEHSLISIRKIQDPTSPRTYLQSLPVHMSIKYKF